MYKVRKREGKIVSFKIEKIQEAIYNIYLAGVPYTIIEDIIKDQKTLEDIRKSYLSR